MENNKPRIYFRADGNATMGLGHVIRSLALAEMSNDIFECRFIIRNPLEALEIEILKVCESIIKLPDTSDDLAEATALASQFQAGDVIVLDGYHFMKSYQQVFKNRGLKVVCIDDIYQSHFVADAIINHAGGIKKWDYSFEKYTKLFLGVEYALVRKPFRVAAKSKAEKPNNLFICLGGADPENHTLEVLQKVEQTGETNTCYLVLGAAYLHQIPLSKFLENTTLQVELLNNLSAEEMVFYMNKCARAITPPSTVAYEYLSTGGTLFLKVIADNQININRYFLEAKLALNFEEDFGKYGEESIEKFLQQQPNLFDGNQKKRFRNIFYRLTTTARLAKSTDCRMYFDWANDPITRQQSFNSEPIIYENHELWFNNRLKDEQSILYVIEFNRQPIGQVRFQLNQKEAVISYSLDKEYRGKGLGIWILKNGITAFRKNHSDYRIIGFVKFKNIASAKIFRALEFKEFVATELENAYKYIY